MEETLACVQHDLDQALLQWLSLVSTQTWIDTAVQEVRAGRDINAYVTSSAVSGGQAGGSAPGGQWLGRSIQSPRRSSPSAPVNTGGVPQRTRGTPPMSPTAAGHGLVHAMRGSPQSPSRASLTPGSPPGSPRHFTFGALEPYNVCASPPFRLSRLLFSPRGG